MSTVVYHASQILFFTLSALILVYLFQYNKAVKGQSQKQ